MTTVVKTIHGFRKGLVASRTTIALMSIGRLAVFMGFAMTAQEAFHHVMFSLWASLILSAPHLIDALLILGNCLKPLQYKG